MKKKKKKKMNRRVAKDKTIKKGAYLPSKTIKKIRKRRWWEIGRRFK